MVSSKGMAGNQKCNNHITHRRKNHLITKKQKLCAIIQNVASVVEVQEVKKHTLYQEAVLGYETL